MTDKINIPYYVSYAADMKAYGYKLSHKEFFEVHDAIADICLFGTTDFNPKPKMQKMYFEKLKKTLIKSIPKYKSSVENGRKGGRPAGKSKKPMGFDWVNPEETHGLTIEKNRKENNKQSSTVNTNYTPAKRMLSAYQHDQERFTITSNMKPPSQLVEWLESVDYDRYDYEVVMAAIKDKCLGQQMSVSGMIKWFTQNLKNKEN